MKTGIGELVKDARLYRGLTQKELGDRLNVSQQAVSSIEAERSTPNIYTLMLIGDALGLRLNVSYR
jgi:transcriptional regulator with XRE-family HTH domain